MRSDPVARGEASDALGISSEWAMVDQIHGAKALVVNRPGVAGRADGIVTEAPGLPLAVFTADCFGVVIHGDGAVGVAHAGWRGLASGVIGATIETMTELGAPPHTAHVGPGIGPCCFEVGDDVAERFSDAVRTTTWGTTSVDLRSVVVDQLTPIPTALDGLCTACGGLFSHRRDQTPSRMAALGWIP